MTTGAQWTPVTRLRSYTTCDGGATIIDPLSNPDGSPGDVAGTLVDAVSINTSWTEVASDSTSWTRL